MIGRGHRGARAGLGRDPSGPAQTRLQTRIRALEELRNKGLLTEYELAQAKANATANATAISIARSQEARNAINDDLLVIKGTQEAVASSLSSSFGRAVADIILEGKTLEEAMKAVFDTILRTAIETFVQIAIQRAIITAGVTAATGGAGGGAGAGLIGGFFGGIGLAEGGIVRKPVFAHVGEAGPKRSSLEIAWDRTLLGKVRP